VVDVAAPDAVTVTATLVNEGTRDAVEVLQVYAHCLDRAGLDRDEPEQRLAGFIKVSVPVGARVTVSIPLHEHTYRRWDATAGSWTHSMAPHELRVGRSSADIAAVVVVQPAPSA
jgi:beta-glucosidase